MMETKAHTHPAWQEKANFIIQAEVEHGGANQIREQLWVRQLSDTRFEVCCIPFFIFDLALAGLYPF